MDSNTVTGGNGGNGGNGGFASSGISAFNLSGGSGGSGGNGEGGGIWTNGGAVSIVSSTLSNNLAGAGRGGSGGNDGSLSGGGGTSFSGGSGGDGGSGLGGGLWADGGTVTVSNSTVSGNAVSGNDGGNGGAGSSSPGSGGDGGDAQGGGLFTDDATVDLRNSTVAFNQAQGAGQGGVNGSSTSSGSSGSSLGGGVAAAGSGVFAAVSSIVARNTAVDFGDDVIGALTDTGNNLIGDLQGSAPALTAGTPNVNASFIGDSAGAGVIDPLLDILTNNGGLTETHALLAGSPAIDTGDDPDTLGTDQRGAGFPRSFGSGPDIGAFEFGAGTVVPGTGYRVTLLRVTTNWRIPTRGRVVLRGEFDNPGAVPPPRTLYPFDGLAVQIDVGGQVFNLALNSRGRAPGLVMIYVRRTNKIRFSFLSPFGDYNAQFADEGLLNDQHYRGVDRNIDATVTFDGTQHTGTVPTKFFSRQNWAGNATGKLLNLP
ncbi:MAG: hypothetical protein M5U26_10005 [Planctomycetota bacterium]|nr:hypothetical protein [Planctomycetota bacterium]